MALRGLQGAINVEFGRVLQGAFDSIRNFLTPLVAKPVPVISPPVPQIELERRRLGLSRGNGSR